MRGAASVRGAGSVRGADTLTARCLRSGGGGAAGAAPGRAAHGAGAVRQGRRGQEHLQLPPGPRAGGGRDQAGGQRTGTGGGGTGPSGYRSCAPAR